MKSSSRIPKEASVEMVRGVWVVMATAGQVHSWLVAMETRNLTRSSPTAVFVRCPWERGAEAVLHDMSS